VSQGSGGADICSLLKSGYHVRPIFQQELHIKNELRLACPIKQKPEAVCPIIVTTFILELVVATARVPKMGYNALDQNDHDHDHNEDRHLDSPSPTQHLASPNFTPPLSASVGLFLDDKKNTSHDNKKNKSRFNNMLNSITSRSTKTTNSYDMVEGDDYAEDVRQSSKLSPTLSANSRKGSPSESSVPLHIPRPRRQATTASNEENNTISPLSRQPKPILRTTSGQSIALRHPTPDLQVLQGAYTGNIEHLERTAERLSMTSSIDDAIRELHQEQKRSDSRRSSLLSSADVPADVPAVTRQISNASSIVEVMETARSGGYSPAGFMMSPKGSFTAGSGRGRSASKSSRFGSRPEPELEGRPLDSFVTTSRSNTSPILSRSASIAEQDEKSATLTLPAVELLGSLDMGEKFRPMEEDRPATSASTNTFDQAQKMFADFDGVHSAGPERRIPEDNSNPDASVQQRAVSGNESNASQDNSQRRASSGNRLSMARPQSYADPSTGQQMVYYPAPVPMMLNLPQRLSKMPSSMARSKRRTQVLSSIPPVARQSAIWLPDVLETEDEPDLPLDDEAQQMEYVPQHQRMSMGGRRSTQDLQHLPPQLRASAFFELQGPARTVEVKEHSAVATLDSILDASAHAPVGAFTDHAFAGHLGAEVYGRPTVRNRRNSTQLLTVEKPKKRTGSFNLLRGRRASSSDLLESANEQQRATMSNVMDGKIRQPVNDDDEDYSKDTEPLQQSEAGERNDDEEEEEEEGQRDDEIYHGPPTTLLAELQLRKQQQKHRTRPLAQVYPNGMHSTLLELDAVAQVEAKSRNKARVKLAWEDSSPLDEEDNAGDDEDVPLAMLYPRKSQVQEPNRPMGLMERRDMEDNEPLSRRRDRLQGRRPAMNRASTMMNLSTPAQVPEDEGETLAQRVRRLKEQGKSATGLDLPSARPVSGDFASEMMSQFGVDLLPDPRDKGKAKESSASPGQEEEEETLGQRRKRLQAEREARTLEVGNLGSPGAEVAGEQRPPLEQRRSMADILQAHPAAGATFVSSYSKQQPVGGLLGLHDQEMEKMKRRSSTMLNLDAKAGATLVSSYSKQQQPVGGLLGLHDQEVEKMKRRSSTMFNLDAKAYAGGFKAGLYNHGQGGIITPAQAQMQQNLNRQSSSYNLFGTNLNAPLFTSPTMGVGGFNAQMGAGWNTNQLFANPYGAMNMNMGYPPMQANQIWAMNTGMGTHGVMPGMNMRAMQMQMQQPLNQGQIDMVERWRQSVMQ
jgi:hypothetical protein